MNADYTAATRVVFEGGPYTLGQFVPLKSTRPADVPYGLCHCGCGESTKIAKQSYTRLGWVRGEPIRFINGHASRGLRRVGFVVEDRGHGTPCWVWQGGKTQDGWRGYGVMANPYRPGATCLVHRCLYMQRYGKVSSALDLDHLCRVRACCNPTHLEVVTRLENVARGARAQRTHCPYGHPYAGENLRVKPDGRRECRACERRRRDAANSLLGAAVE